MGRNLADSRGICGEKERLAPRVFPPAESLLMWRICSSAVFRVESCNGNGPQLRLLSVPIADILEERAECTEKCK
ncbi:hypothetical protein MTO96_024719 [Rhipicephalus appendiculatus]